MTIKQIHYFIAVAETKSFTNAARNYFIAQTAMSQQISALEKELGFLLFHRSNRSVELTQAGQVLYDQLRPLVLNLERAVESASAIAGVQSTIFRIGLFDQAVNRFLVPALHEFSEAESNATPLLISDNHIMLLESLSNRTIDAVLLGKRYYQSRASLEATELFSYQVLDYVLAVRRMVRPARAVPDRIQSLQRGSAGSLPDCAAAVLRCFRQYTAFQPGFPHGAALCRSRYGVLSASGPCRNL